MELLNNMVILFLFFLETSILFFIVAAAIYIAMNNVQGFPFSSHHLQHLLFLDFVDSPSDRCEMIALFIVCISLIISKVEHLFLFLLANCISSLENWWLISSVYLLIRLFFYIEMYDYVLYTNLSQSWYLQIFSCIL